VEIRKYQFIDCKEIIEFFYNTVHTINARDYSQAQLNVWATSSVDSVKWNQSLSDNFTVVAVETGVVVGFGDINNTGYIDRLFVHKDYQRMGIASAVLSALEKYAVENDIRLLSTHASITAKAFFAAKGYWVVREQQIEREDQVLTNFVMEKHLQSSAVFS